MPVKFDCECSLIVTMQGGQHRHCSSRRGVSDAGAAADAPPGPSSCRARPPGRCLRLPTGSGADVLGHIFMLSLALSLGAMHASTAVSDYGTPLAESVDRKGRGEMLRFLPAIPMLLSSAGQYSFAAYRKGGGASQRATVAPMPRYGGGAATSASASEATGGPQDSEALADGSGGGRPLWVVREADLSAIQVGAAWLKPELAGLQFPEWIITNQKICIDRLRRSVSAVAVDHKQAIVVVNCEIESAMHHRWASMM